MTSTRIGIYNRALCKSNCFCDYKICLHQTELRIVPHIQLEVLASSLGVRQPLICFNKQQIREKYSTKCVTTLKRQAF